MKTIYLFLLALLPIAFAPPATAQKLSKKEKAEQLEKAFQTTKALVESKQFKVEIDRAFPVNGMDLSRFNPRGEIVVRDSIAQGELPFFGRAYSLPYGEDGGIEFDNRMKEEKIKVVEKRKKKSIVFTFTVVGKYDQYQFAIEAHAGGICTVNMNSNNRAHISYSGTIGPLEESDGDK